MKLQTVEIKNFRSIKHMSFDFPENNLLILVGPNNAGKSNIISAIDAICGESWYGKEKMEDHDFYLRNRDARWRIELSFDNGNNACLSNESKWPEYKNRHNVKIYTSIKEAFPCTYLGADRTLDKHLAFYDWTLIGKIRKQFHQRALPLQDELQAKFEELVEIFDKVEGFGKFKADFARFFEEMQSDTPARLDINFKPFTPSNYFKSMQILAADPNQGAEQLDLEELGEGSRNTVLLALLRSYAVNFRQGDDQAPGILALEEPEIFLHPQARRHLYSVLREIADSGVQVVISTHSASFVDTEHFDSIGQVYKQPDIDNAGRTHTGLRTVSKADLVEHCVKTGVPPGKITEENVTEFYRTTSNYRLNEAFFAKFIVLVEGETEELTIPEYLRARGLDCDLQGVSMIAVNGKNQIPKYWRLFGQFNPNILCVFDNDESSSSKMLSNVNIGKCFGLPLQKFKNISLYRELVGAGSPASPLIVLEEDFEKAIRKEFRAKFPQSANSIDDYEAEAKRLIRPVGDQAKGQIARFIARRLRENYPSFTPSFILAIERIVRTGLGGLSAIEEDLEDDDIPF